MVQEPAYFTAGQFAKLHHINKRTLHYNDEIELFSPACKAENGYRYYTYQQSPMLEMILTLRELNMSIEEITQYMQQRSPARFQQMVQAKTEEIDETIRRLKAIRTLLQEKQKQLAWCDDSHLSRMEVVQCPAEYLLLSRPITGAYDAADFAVLTEHMQALRSHRLFNKSYGCMIAVDRVAAGNFEKYDCFFTKMDKPTRKADLFVKPAGRYIRAFCKGTWDRLPERYAEILTFAAQNGLTLRGYCYDEGINEMAIATMDEYVTQIMIRCE